MLNFLLLQCIQSAPFAIGDSLIPRVNRENAFSNTFTTTFHAPNPLSLQTKTKGTKASFNAFQFQFNCDSAVSPQLCLYAQEGFESAGSRISQALSISSTIIVQARFHSFCAAQGQGSNCQQVNNTLGRASSAAYFAGSTSPSATTYYYPQVPNLTLNHKALIKQLRTSEALTFASADIFAEFNSDFDFWFKQSGLPIGANQTDFEFVICHELTHGLGFDSGWVQYSTYFAGMTTTNYLAPLPFSNGPSPSSAVASVLSPLTVFDQFLASPTTSLATLGKSVSKFQGPGLVLPVFVSTFESSGDPAQAAKNAMTAATAGDLQPLQFQAPSSPAISLNSPTTFQPGTSIVHVQSKMYTTTDFLMVPAIKPLIGQKLDDIITNNKGTGIYGSGTIAILNAIGWPTATNPNVGSVIIQRDFANARSGAYFRSPFTGAHFVMLVWCLLI